MSRYIHRNPVESKRPLVENLTDYRWSSYPAYRDRIQTPSRLFKDAVFSELASSQVVAKYKHFVEQGVDDETESFYKKGWWPAVRGDKSFAESAYLHALSIGPEVSTDNSLVGFSSVVAATARYFECSELAVMESRRGCRNEKRWLVMKLAQEFTGESLKELAVRFDVASNSTISQTVGRLNRGMVEDSKLASGYFTISQDLTT